MLHGPVQIAPNIWWSWAIACIAGTLLAASPAAAQCQYDATVIQGPWCGDFFGYPPTYGTAISDSGVVVGYYSSCLVGPDVAFVWRPETGLVRLGRPAGFTDARAWDIDGSRIVGILEMDNKFHAVLWQGGDVIKLGTLPGGNFSEALGVSGSRIVGNWGNNINGPIHGFIWEDGVMMNLGPTLGTTSSRARGISDAGQVVGWMGSGYFVDGEAFIWKKGVATGLGPIPGGLFSIAEAINHSGNVVGWGLVPADGFPIGQPRGFLWQDGTMIDLGPLPGLLRSGALDINDAGVVVGLSWDPGSAGFVWQDGVMTDLNDLVLPEAGVHVDVAYAINNKGQIISVGHDAQGDVVAVLLTPIDRPPGDLDIDCAVGLADLEILLDSWGPCPDCVNCLADLDGDCRVAVPDLLTLLANWG